MTTTMLTEMGLKLSARDRELLSVVLLAAGVNADLDYCTADDALEAVQHGKRLWWLNSQARGRLMDLEEKLMP